LKWQVFVDAWGDGTVDFAYSSFVPGTGSWATTWNNSLNGIPTKYMAPTAPGGNITVIFKDPVAGKYSKHKITYKVTDGCHNYSSCTEELTVTDLKPPTPYCIHLSTALMAVPQGAPAGTTPMVEIWAKDFDRGAEDGCTAREDLRYTFGDGKINPAKLEVAHYFNDNGEYTGTDAATRYRAGELQYWRPADKSSAMIFTSPGTKDLKVRVWDWNLNSDWCSVDLRIVCNGNGCPTNAGSRIAGTVATESNQTVNNVTVTIDANIAEYPVSVTTPSTGSFERTVPNDLDYEVTASKAGDFLNGVSTLDLVMIQRHILGIQALATPYK
jgi:hypothetical protein